MKNVFAGALLLACVVLASGTLYYPFEELGRQRQGDLLIKKISDSLNEGRDSMTKWSESSVPYVFSANFTGMQQALVQGAMKEIEDVSCVRFRPKEAKHSNYVLISSQESGCWSALGMFGGEQLLNLDPRGCLVKGLIMHQLMHALGFMHPDMRPDRDLYVQVMLGNVNNYDMVNFDKAAPGVYDDFGMPYDYESILHRSGFAYSATGRNTIIPLYDDIELGQREKLSAKDIRKLNKMYPCQIQ
ncbi:zinc metalloproteinase nas-4-like [Ochlerotatus camptorhynchus]|uniref:zinc metalloproteinase nas-4-like n=1 Tax=Ochlerotatus camptorhynchus TaxID=644619 RepID=UPI0031D7DCEE